MNDKSLKLSKSGDSDELLEQTLKGIRDEPIPEFPDPPLSLSQAKSDQPTVAITAHSIDSKVKWWSGRMRYLAISATAIAVFFATLLMWPQSNQSAFARMQEALQEVSSVSYSVFDYHGNGDTWETKACILEPGFTRSEQIKIGEEIVSLGIQISDNSRNLRLHIDPTSRKATFYEVSPSEEMAARRNQFIEKLRNVQEHSTQDLGPTSFNDKPARAFMLTLGMGGREFKVYVDSESNLPVHMEYEGALGFREVFTNFVFDEEMDVEQFALKAPEGYEVEHVAMLDAAENAELLVVSPKTGIGPVAFGSYAESIVEFLGKPSQRQIYAPATLPGSDQPGQGFEYLIYNSLGLEIGVNSEYGVTTIRCQSQKRNGPTVRDFAGQTTEGIRIGSTVAEVIAAYGKPERETEETVHYIRLGWLFWVLEGKVVGFEVQEPTHDQIEIIVNEDGSYTERTRKPIE